MSQLEVELQLQAAIENARSNGIQDALDVLRATIDSMKSDSQTPTASIMNAVLEEVYTRAVERLKQEKSNGIPKDSIKPRNF